MDLVTIIYWLYLISCAVLVPLWALKQSRIAVAYLLLLVPAGFAFYLNYYLTNPQYQGDHGIAIAGLFITLPIVSLLCQLVLYKVFGLLYFIKQRRG